MKLLDPEKVINNYSSIDRFLIWLYFPGDFISHTKAIKISKSYTINPQFIVRKIIENCVSKDMSFNDVYRLLLKDGITNDEDYIKNIIQNIYDVAKKKSNITLTKNNISDLLKIKNKILINKKINDCSSTCDSDVHHTGIPLNDPELGRPMINWKKCYYDGCFKEFISSNDLIRHLEINKVYTKSFHFYHQLAVDTMNLTPQKIKNQNIDRCPSFCCYEYHDKKLTPQQVIDHLDDLGIKPFFTGTRNIVSKTESKSNILDDYVNLQFLKIFSVMECIACYDNKSTIICVPCGHCVLCPKCVNMFKKNTCPLCNCNYDYIVPL